MNFDYNLSDQIDREYIRIANNTMIERCDELWVFGEIGDGVLVEIYLAQKLNLPIRFFRHIDKTSFREIDREGVQLEDVSPWMWEYICAGRDLERWHPRLRFHKTYPLIYPAYSKRNFYWQTHISLYCLNRRVIPLNPFMLFRYFLGDGVTRQSAYQANNNIVRICDEVWSFGDVSDGVLAEIKLKRAAGQPTKYFDISSSNPFQVRQIQAEAVRFEKPELEEHRDILTMAEAD